jgi:delta 1-pyrroline-5-carboxylate dehydrogenase
MENEKFILLNKNVQEIIDLIAAKNGKEANNRLAEVSEQLDDFLDFQMRTRI